MRKPMFGDAINHRNFKICLSQVLRLADLLPPETIILIVGPSHSGKSTLLGYLVAYLLKHVFTKCGPRERPIIGTTAQTSREGRTTPKFVLHELLEEVGHPFLQMAPVFNGNKLYTPALKFDETWSLRALKSALHAAGVRVVLIDDAHYLVRAKDEAFKSSLLESLKSLVTPITTLVLSGGYDLAEVALANRAHLSSRIITVHVPRYGDSEEDLEIWAGIIGNMSESSLISLDHPDLLLTNAEALRYDCHGDIGVLEKRLVKMLVAASAHGTSISADIIAETRPTSVEWNAMRLDIEKGETLLGTTVGVVEISDPEQNEETKTSKPDEKGKNGKGNQGDTKNKQSKNQRPFERAPTRTQKAVEV